MADVSLFNSYEIRTILFEEGKLPECSVEFMQYKCATQGTIIVVIQLGKKSLHVIQ
jgi:hypothetical protein